MAVTVPLIESGYYGGSPKVAVACDLAAGTTIVLYKFVNDVDVLVGSGTLGNDVDLGAGRTRIDLTTNIAEGNQLMAYVTEIGNQASKPKTVKRYQDGDEILTGWSEPDLVITDTGSTLYLDFLEQGGSEIADKYTPSPTINTVVPRFGTRLKQIATGNVVIVQSPGTPTGSAVASVVNTSPALGAARAKWDSGPIQGVLQKTFTSADNGSHTVEVIPESASGESTVIPFEINIIDGGTPPVTTAIWSAGYEINPVADRQVSLIAYSDSPLEARIKDIPGYTGNTWVAMSGGTGAKYNMAPYTNVPAGTYVGEVRRIGTVEVYTVDVRIKF